MGRLRLPPPCPRSPSRSFRRSSWVWRSRRDHARSASVRAVAWWERPTWWRADLCGGGAGRRRHRPATGTLRQGSLRRPRAHRKRGYVALHNQSIDFLTTAGRSTPRGRSLAAVRGMAPCRRTRRSWPIRRGRVPPPPIGIIALGNGDARFFPPTCRPTSARACRCLATGADGFAQGDVGVARTQAPMGGHRSRQPDVRTGRLVRGALATAFSPVDAPWPSAERRRPEHLRPPPLLDVVC